MKKATFALTSLAALTVTCVAFAQDPPGGPMPTPAPGPAQASPQPAPDVANPPAPPPPQPIPSLITPGGASDLPAAVTEITAAEITTTPPPASPPPRETITVRQTYRPNRPMLYTGGAMLISSYAATAAVTMMRNVRDASHDQPTLVPVAGPWMHLANSNAGMLDKALLAGSGVAQGVGLVIGVLSFIVPEHVPAATIQAGGVQVMVTASTTGPGSAGLGAIGRF